MAARPRFRDPDGVLRLRWFAGALFVFWVVCLGLAAIGGWTGIVLVALAQLAAVAVIIVSADPARGEGEGRAGGAAGVTSQPGGSGADGS